MQQEVAKRMDDLAAQRSRHRERAAVDHRSRWRGGDGSGVADGAADLVEQVVSGHRVSRGRQRGVARWSLSGAHETGKTVDVIQTIRTQFVFRIGCGLANGGEIGGSKPVGYAHLVDVSVAGKGKQAGLLVLPTEASATHCAVRFRHRNLDELTGNGAAALSGLRVGY